MIRLAVRLLRIDCFSYLLKTSRLSSVEAQSGAPKVADRETIT